MPDAMKQSELERAFETRWRQLHPELPMPVQQYRGIPGRKFRFDMCWRGPMVVVELQGGTWSRGRHTRGQGYENDCEKLNLAQMHGWMVFYLTTTMLKNDPKRWLDFIADAIQDRTCQRVVQKQGLDCKGGK